MKPIKFLFALDLEDWSIEEGERPHGPLFSRWIPNGVDDAVNLLADSGNDHIRIWFQRRGELVNDFIRYDRKAEGVPVSMMVRQGKLDAGPLFGEYITSQYMIEELDAALSESVNDDVYIQFGKRIVSAISGPVSSFIHVLRCTYGQYWLPPLRSWDSREMSLGTYCANLYLRLVVDGTTDEIPFLPTNQGYRMEVKFPGKGFREYLTESDWRFIQSMTTGGLEVSLAMRILGSVSQLIDNRMLRQAFLEATTSFELAMGEYCKQVFGNANVDDRYKNQLSNIGLAARLIAIAPGLQGHKTRTISDAIRALEIRNEIAHEGYHPTGSDERYLRQLCEVIGQLLGHFVIKLPSLDIGNSLTPPEGHASDNS